MRYAPEFVLLLALPLTAIREQPRQVAPESVRVSNLEQRLNRRIERFDTAGRTLVACVADLAFTYELPTAIEYADRDAAGRPLNLTFHNESIRRILEAIVLHAPQYRVDFGHGIVDLYAPQARENPSNLLNNVVKDFAVTQVDTHEADFQLFCAVSRELDSQACAGSIAVGQWPTKITLHLQNVKVYEVLDAIVAENGKAIWTVMVRPDKLSKLQAGGNWYIYPLQQPFRPVVLERLAIASH